MFGEDGGIMGYAGTGESLASERNGDGSCYTRGEELGGSMKRPWLNRDVACAVMRY